MAENKQGYFLGGIFSALAGKALLPKILGGIVATKALEKVLGSKSGTNKESVEEALARFNATPKTTDPLKNLFKSKYTTIDEAGNEVSPHFDTAEARDAYDDKIEKDYLNQPITQLYSGLALGGQAQAESGIGGLIQGPGNVTSDSIPGGIMQNGQKVEEILVSNGEVIFSGKDLENLDPDGNIERAGKRLGNAPNGTRGAEAARMYAEVQSAQKGKTMAETTQTSITDLPEYQKEYLQEILQRAQALGKQAYTLPSYQVAGRTPIQQQATNLATQGIGAYMPMLQAGEKATSAGIAATESLLDPNAAMAFMNPFQKAVSDEINRAYDIQAKDAGLAAVGQPGGPSAFGGSRSKIAELEIDRNRASALAQAQAQAFGQAQQQQLARAQSAAQGLGSLGMQQAKLGEAFQGLNINDINMLSSLGGQEQQQRQRELDAARQTQYQNVMQPYQQLGFYSDIFQGMPTSQTTFTSQQSPDPSMLSQIGGLGMGLYSLGKANMFG